MKEDERMKETESLIAQMTLEEKISILAGADFWHTVPVKRLGIPAMKVTDGPVGARGAGFSDGPTSACFPAGVALAATWNPGLVERVGKALAEEVQAKGANILLAPTVNMHRSPLAGRNFECYSEDPYLTGRLAVAYITGLQSKGVGACIKHFVCNDSEFERRSISSEVGERALREIYLRPFEIAVRDARPWAVMSAYNRINGTYASENDYLLLDILKGEWGFEGIVISDWFGTYSPNLAKGGLDLEMPGPARWMGEKALKAVQSGEVGEKAIDDKVRRLLRTMHKAGLFEHPELQPEQAIDRPEHRRLAREAASEAIVLLKNDMSLLPLDSNVCKSIAVIGENAEKPAFIGGGSCRVRPHYVVSPLEGIQSRAGESVQVGYALGCVSHKYLPAFDKNWLTDGIALQYFSNQDLAGGSVHTETASGLEMTWFGDAVPNVDLTDFSARLTAAFSVPESGTYELSLSSTGKSRLFVNGDLVIDLWDDIPSVRDRIKSTEIAMAAGQPHQLQIECASRPAVSAAGLSGPDLPLYRLRLGCALQVPADSIQQAVALAAKSDVAIVFAGLTDEWESEDFDRPDMELPGDQAKLIEHVAAANPNTIVVLNVGSPLHMDWLDKVGTVVQAWYLGQETGNAIADVLFGDVNPSGRLPTTFPKRLQDNPAYLNYPGENGQVLYGEGLFTGYRYYDKKDIAPLFPFGYGLSYTTFAYRNLKLSKPKYAADDTIQFSVDVENTGSRAGEEIVQVYLRDVQSRLVRPEKELKAFAKVALEPGETKKVTFTLDKEALSYYDPASRRWVAEAGEFQVLVGSSSRDIQLAESFDFEGEPSPQ
jgi:beta-glucosidase